MNIGPIEGIKETSPSDRLKSLRGSVSIVCTTGLIAHETYLHLSEMRNWNHRNGLTQVEYRNVEAKLVEAGRDDVCAHALKENYDYLLMVDGDAAPFPPFALGRMLQLVFEIQPMYDVLGGYCQVKGGINLPTIDTGTGTWQTEPAYQGTLPVIRTGGHFLLVKTPILRQFGPPWFRTRQSLTDLKVLSEFDNLCRTKLDGKNPLQGSEEWHTLMSAAVGERGSPSHVGEDSAFCDGVRAVGGHIAVDTDLVIGHVAKDIILPRKLIENLEKVEKNQFATVGVLDYQ